MQVRIDSPVLYLVERFDFALALDDKTQSDGLHASCRESAANFVPEQRRKLIPDNAVKHTARLLSIDEIAIDVAGMCKSGLQRLGDFVEGNPRM